VYKRQVPNAPCGVESRLILPQEHPVNRGS